MLEALDVATNLPPVDGRSHAIFLLDLNGFKHVNDRYGHAVGDEVLQAVVERFRRAARTNDVFARLGGDEFAVLSRNVDEEAARAIGERFIACATTAKCAAGDASHAIGVADRRGALSQRRRYGGEDPPPRRRRHVPCEVAAGILARVLQPRRRHRQHGAQGDG